jgi:hypothetical protein
MADQIRDKRKDPFFKVDNALIDREDFDIYEKMVYVVLCKYAGNNGGAFPSYNTIAHKAGCSRRKAIDAVASLIEKEVITKEIRINDKDENISNLYDIVGVGGSAHSAPPSAPDAPPPGAQDAPPSAHGAPKKETLNKTHSSYKESVSQSVDGQTESPDLIQSFRTMVAQCQLGKLDKEKESMVEEALKGLYFDEGFANNTLMIPLTLVRESLGKLHYLIIEHALYNFRTAAENGTYIKSPTKYLQSCIFFAISEFYSGIYSSQYLIQLAKEVDSKI